MFTKPVHGQIKVVHTRKHTHTISINSILLTARFLSGLFLAGL